MKHVHEMLKGYSIGTPPVMKEIPYNSICSKEGYEGVRIRRVMDNKFGCRCSQLAVPKKIRTQFLDVFTAIGVYSTSKLIEEPELSNFYYRNTYECRGCNNIYITPVKSRNVGMKLTLQ